MWGSALLLNCLLWGPKDNLDRLAAVTAAFPGKGVFLAETGYPYGCGSLSPCL
jgi:hypothetical protein